MGGMMRRRLAWALVIAIVLLALQFALVTPIRAQTAPVLAGEALPGSGGAAPATSTITGRQVKLPATLSLCLSGGNYVVCPAAGAMGPQPSAASQSVTPATDSDFARKSTQQDGSQRTQIVGPANSPVVPKAINDGGPAFTDLLIPTKGVVYGFDPNAASGTPAQTPLARADQSGMWFHAPTSTPTTAGGTGGASGTTIAVTFTNTTDGEFVNPSTSTWWCSWGTPAVNGANSYPILANGQFRPLSRVAGTWTCLSTAASQPFTFTRY